jgi:hypothetical protein
MTPICMKYNARLWASEFVKWLVDLRCMPGAQFLTIYRRGLSNSLRKASAVCITVPPSDIFYLG